MICSSLDEDVNLRVSPEETEIVNQELKVLKNNKVVLEGIKDYEHSLGNTSIKTYTPNVEIEIESKLDKKYGNDGIYLSQDFAKILTNDNIDILKDTNLQIPIYVPIYNASGVTKWVNENGDEFECNEIATKKVLVTLPIAGVLKGASLYDTDINSLGSQIFILREIYEKYIEQYKEKDDMTIYWTAENEKAVKYMNEYPESQKENIIQTIKATVWEPNCYVATIDNLENLEIVLKQINDIGLNAKSLYINSTSLKESVESMQRSVQMAGGVILFILCLVGYQNKKSNKESEKETTQCLKNVGLLPKQIKNFKLRKYFIFFIIQSMVCIILGLGIIQLLNSMMYGNTNWSMMIVIIIVSAVFIIEFIFPTFIELKKEKG